MRLGLNVIKDGLLYNGFDYTKQAWVIGGKYVKCSHPEDMNCNCYGKVHEGELSITKESKIT